MLKISSENYLDYITLQMIEPERVLNSINVTPERIILGLNSAVEVAKIQQKFTK